MEKTLIMDSNQRNGLDLKYLQILVADTKDETLYSAYQGVDEGTGKITSDTHELAVDINDMIKMRDWLTKQINKIAKKKYPYPKSLTNYYGDIYEIVEE